MSGFFVSFEGGEGCGKSTQVERARTWLEARGEQVLVTREPGGTPLAERIRDVLLDPNATAMQRETELLLYAAARAQHVAERIRPALDEGAFVLCDRYADSTWVYQGVAGGFDLGLLAEVHRWTTGDLWPDRTYVLDVGVEVGFGRARERGTLDRIEKLGVEFHERVRQGFLDRAETCADRIRVVDGTHAADFVAATIATDLAARLEIRGRAHV